MVFLYILGGLVLLIAALMQLPLRLLLEYDGQAFTARLKLLWFTIGFGKERLGKKPKEKQSPKAKAGKKKNEPTKQKKTLRELKELVVLGGKLLRRGFHGLGYLLRRVYIDELNLHMTVATDNAADTALLYGRIHAGLGSLFWLLYQFEHLGEVHVTVAPDFQAKESTVNARGCIRVRTGVLVWFILRVLCALLVLLLQTKWKGGGKQPEPSQEKGGQERMGSHPIDNMMNTSMQKIKEMVDVNAIIGDPIKISDTVTIIPVSKVSFGFASGGSDIPSKQQKELFGGGSGAGIYTSLKSFPG